MEIIGKFAAKQNKNHNPMRYLILFMLLVAVFVLGKRSCHFSGFGVKGTGPVQTETRTVTGFKSISLDASADVEVAIGDYKVEVEAQQNILPLLKTEVRNGQLNIYFSENVASIDKLVVRITAPALESLNLGGSGVIQVVTPIQSDKMEVNIGGSGEVKIMQGDFNTLNCSIGGSGDIALAGKTNSGSFGVSGSGGVQAEKMSFNNLDVQISGSGSIDADIVQTLKASISGSGEVNYTGNPTVESSVSGSGSVNRR
jgi:Putative auto-transporter adhesin, head GIN domain